MQRVELDEDEDRSDLAAPAGPDDELAATVRRPRRSRRGAVLLGAVFLGERLELFELAGMALIGIGLVTIDGRLFSRRKAVAPV